MVSNQQSYQQYINWYLDPCAHNKCGKNSQCEFDASAEFGYNCVCKYPFTLNPNNPSAYNNDDGCMATDHRNVDDSFADGEIIFGGGWHYNRPPGSKRSEESNPSDRYYGLRATSDPYRYKVLQLSERMPGNRSKHFYIISLVYKI